MAKRKRGTFEPDLGDHPPPLNEFLSDWHRTDRRSGRIRWGLLPKFGREEVRANARWFGRLLIITSLAMCAAIWWGGAGRLREDAILPIVILGVPMFVGGVALLWTYRRP